MLGTSAESDLPPYVTTGYEISKEEKIYPGTWSTVWRGRWQNCVVAIKEVPITAEVTRQVGLRLPSRLEKLLAQRNC